MIFTEARFLEFFVLVFALHWALPGNAQRKVLLLVASYVFYAAWDWRFLSLIIISGLVDFVVGIKIFDTDDESRRRRWLCELVREPRHVGLLQVLQFLRRQRR